MQGEIYLLGRSMMDRGGSDRSYKVSTPQSWFRASRMAELDEGGFRAILEFLRGKGLTKVVVNGATGEYCLTTAPSWRSMLAICRETLPGGEVLCSIGAAGLAGCLELGRVAIEHGARALLLPMPHFFPYSQDDLHAFCAAVAARLDAPILLYNLPRFTTPIELETVRGLIDSVPNIIGIKDSSGSLAILGGLSSGGLPDCGRRQRAGRRHWTPACATAWSPAWPGCFPN